MSSLVRLRERSRGASRHAIWFSVVAAGVVILAIFLALVLTRGGGGPRWGIVGDVGLDDHAVRASGIRLRLLQISWEHAEPRPNEFDKRYFARARERLDRWRSDGFGVVLNYGMQSAPSWFLHIPNARFVNQFGALYTQGTAPNLVFDRTLRSYA